MHHKPVVRSNYFDEVSRNEEMRLRGGDDGTISDRACVTQPSQLAEVT